MDAGGAALGAGFGLLLETVKESIDKTVMFKPTLKSIKGTLECLQPLIQDIKGLNMELDLPEGETTDFDLEMKQGEKLVAKCSKVSRWKFFKKSRYTGKLLELDQTLKRLIRILQVQGTRDTKENLKLTREIHTSFIRNNGGNNRVVCDSIISARTCGVPQVLPPLIMGMDEALEELKMRLLLKDGASLLVVTAPGGCGKKTLLAQKFCLDHQSPRHGEPFYI
ncbi:probable disease resistance protein At5g66900 isoform X1 [Ziziphus jujuba]|uniref:Probable disease resistance protein At5g66900 isoform X1 n=1 Tax=Ziziphus jujuba TaxID=326968 RepID=A0ABM3IBA2_ZIZJJ|nr:probable disease resistance protein At5g66900 isoform X1 [Ziziphus jujuba]